MIIPESEAPRPYGRAIFIFFVAKPRRSIIRLRTSRFDEITRLFIYALMDIVFCEGG